MPELTRPSPRTDRRRAFAAAFGGWMLDGYDFTMLTLVLVDVQRELSITSAAAGALGTVTLLTRLVGGVVAGRAADRWGRRGPLLVSILWFAVFSFLSGFSQSFGVLFALRALFGLGMGGEWTAGMTLVLEHYPARQGVVLGVLQGAFSWGFILAAVVFDLAQRLAGGSAWGWRALLWSGLAPAVLVLLTRRSVPESPLWLAGRVESPAGWRPALASVRGIAGAVGRATLVLGALMFAYQAMSFWYSSMLRQAGRAPLAYLVALNVGGIVGAALWGALGDSRLGRRGCISVASATTVAALPLFLYAPTSAGLWLGALVTGLTGAGILGIAPTYIGGQFTTALRGIGSGFVYHMAAVVGALAPYALGVLQDNGLPLKEGMAALIGGASLLAIAVAWSGPERAGEQVPLA